MFGDISTKFKLKKNRFSRFKSSFNFHLNRSLIDNKRKGIDMYNHSIENLKNNLIRDKRFLKFESTKDQIEFILKNVRPLAHFREQVFRHADNHISKHMKSLEESKHFRNKGLVYSKNGEYLSAHLMFTKAVLSAPFPHENDDQNNILSLSYASKSLTEFQMKCYQSSLLSADNSLIFNETNEMLLHRIHCLRQLKRFPESLKEINQLIHKRQNSLNKNMDEVSVENLMAIKNYIVNQMSDPENTSNVSQKMKKEFISYINKNMPKDTDEMESNLYLHKSCVLNFDERKGRYFRAENLIPKNTVVLKEKPMNACPYGESRLKVCLNCNKWIGYDIWPCIGCDEVVFCDKNCFIEANNEFHRKECGLVGQLNSYGLHFAHTFRIMSRVGLQMVFKREEQNTDIDFNQYIKYETQLKNRQISDVFEVNRERLKQLKSDIEYHGFHSLTHHNDKYDKLNNLHNCLKAIEMSLLFDYTKQLNFDIEEDFQMFVTLVIITIKNIRRVFTNVFGWFENVDRYDLMIARPANKCGHTSNTRMTYIGSSICNVSALFNHSCKPNLHWSFEKGIMTFKTVADIRAGQEICVTYGPTAKSMRLAERQQKLRNCYFFDCNCEKCLQECCTVLCIRCQHCWGPVVFTEPQMKEMEEKVCCLQCGQEFKNPKQTMNTITKNCKLFDQNMRKLEINHNIQSSLRVAKHSLDVLINLVYSKCQPLKQYIRKFVGFLVFYNHSSEAVEYFRYFDIAKESKDIESDGLLDDLILLTDCYYKFLNTYEIVDTNHWMSCFRFYEKLIELLKKQKKSLEMLPQKLYEIRRISSKIEDKNEEFTKLYESYLSLKYELK